MEKTYRFLASQANWRSETKFTQHRIPEQIRSIVLDKGSLTTALVELSDNNFQVNIVSQRLALPYWHEQRKLRRPQHHAALVREVELLVHGEAVVFARSIIPPALLSKRNRGLANLGNNPLGHLLFRDGRIRVSKRELAIITGQHAELYARRTPYDYLDSQILVSEFFLPALANYLAK